MDLDWAACWVKIHRLPAIRIVTQFIVASVPPPAAAAARRRAYKGGRILPRLPRASRACDGGGRQPGPSGRQPPATAPRPSLQPPPPRRAPGGGPCASRQPAGLPPRCGPAPTRQAGGGTPARITPPVTAARRFRGFRRFDRFPPGLVLPVETRKPIPWCSSIKLASLWSMHK